MTLAHGRSVLHGMVRCGLSDGPHATDGLIQVVHCRHGVRRYGRVTGVFRLLLLLCVTLSEQGQYLGHVFGNKVVAIVAAVVVRAVVMQHVQGFVVPFVRRVVSTLQRGQLSESRQGRGHVGILCPIVAVALLLEDGCGFVVVVLVEMLIACMLEHNGVFRYC